MRRLTALGAAGDAAGRSARRPAGTRERERDRPKDVVGLFLSPAAQVETMEIPLKKYLQQNKFNYSN